MSFVLNRRAALAALGLCAVGLGFGPAKARPRPAEHASGGIWVDVGPLRANGGGTLAQWVEQTLPGALAQAMASAGQGGVSVTARIEYVLLGPSSGGVGPAGSSPDQMIGDYTINGVTRPLRASTWYYPSSVDQTMIEQTNFLRVQQLSQAFASWVARGA